MLLVVCAVCAWAAVLEDADEWKLWKEVYRNMRLLV